MRHQSQTNHRARPNSANPVPTMTSKERCTTLTRLSGGRTAAGIASSPFTSVEGLKPDSSDAPDGTGTPKRILPSTSTPPSVSGAWVRVCGRASMAANLAGSASKT